MEMGSGSSADILPTALCCTICSHWEDSQPKPLIKRFEHIWLKDDTSHQIIKEEWDKTEGNTQTKLLMVFEKIYQWGNEKYGNVPRQTQELKDTTPTKGDLEQIKKLEYKLDDLIKHEEEWWVQRAKANWLAHGDKYLKYFHFKASQRKRKNKFGDCILILILYSVNA
ncbi:uncharacterized protein LOC123889009 [Trifolium pratense]|uniref:uncharacterized protein LOC123889009 n=1 Tax=Trifolium pratense TaxID=57577 RepID=UPI001E69240D|nr:uncharacterized protein LOC123889009 [Trifolium pratense]